MSQQNDLVRTGVDELLVLVKKKKKISVADAAKQLKVPEHTIQNWVDFLIEEDILGVEYKFITPYIYLNEHSPARLSRQNKDTLQLREEFFAKAKSRNLPREKIEVLWKQYVTENMETIKQEFIEKVKERGIEEANVDRLWDRYQHHLLEGS
jgi:DNA-binding transcriptional regulator YhcF (GntR family)